VVLLFGKMGFEPIQMQMPGGHLFAAEKDGGNTIQFAFGKLIIESLILRFSVPIGCAFIIW